MPKEHELPENAYEEVSSFLYKKIKNNTENQIPDLNRYPFFTEFKKYAGKKALHNSRKVYLYLFNWYLTTNYFADYNKKRNRLCIL